jgi:hypothetical protein
MHFLLPYVRLELLIRTMLTRQLDEDAWPMVKAELRKALEMRSRLRRAGWWN